MATFQHRAQRLYSFSGLLLLGLLGTQQPDQAEAIRAFFLGRAELEDIDLAAVDTGGIQTKFLATDAREIAVFSVVHLDVPAGFAAERLRSVELWGLSEADPALGVFSFPPRLEDLAGLQLPRQDLDALSSCESGACELKLSAAMIERLRREIDWSVPGSREAAEESIRRMMVEYLEAYLGGGHAALGSYADKEPPLDIGEGFDTLFAWPTHFAESEPKLQRYLASYPSASLEGTTDLFYWTVEDFGIKPVAALYHSTIYNPAAGDAALTIIVSKQFYSSHYFQAALRVMAVIDDGRAERPGCYVVYSRRYRFDDRLTGIRRFILRSAMRAKVTAGMLRLRQQVESEFRGRPGP